VRATNRGKARRYKGPDKDREDGGLKAAATGAAEFRVGGFGNIREVELAILHRLCAPCGSLGALMMRMISLPSFTFLGV